VKIIKEISKGKIGFSNHNFEKSIISGLKHHNINLKCVSVPSVYTYPYNCTKSFIDSERYKEDNVDYYSVGFLNYPIINKKIQEINLKRLLCKVFEEYEGDELFVIINKPSYILLKAFFNAIKTSKKKIKSTVIVPDIPQMVSDMGKSNPLKSYLLKKMDADSMKMASKCDSAVLLTKEMMDFFEPKIPYIVMEGIVDVDGMDKSCELTGDIDDDKKIVLYTGTLREIFGVKNLVDAYIKGKTKDSELWICGSGDSEQYILNKSLECEQIKFWGLVDSDEALKKQRQATILVNPRTSDGEYTKYSFPSKTMEYLLAGKASIINKLPGIPTEYYEYVFIPENESIDALAIKINELLLKSKDELVYFGQRGRKFVIENKNSVVQTKRILDLLING
jgi:glycosyltransferase involved in cell wall biosynthesis